jgi:DNA ligase-1
MSQSLTFGPIFNQQNNKIRIWSIVINLYDDDHKLMSITTSDMDIPEKSTSEYYTISGYENMKMTTSAPTIITSGKNLGKSNETTVLSQAYKECKSKYDKKIKSGYSEDIKDQTKSKERFPFPMALKPWKDFKQKLQYPLYIQPKLDGIRMIVMLDSDGNVQLRTRRLHDVPKFDLLKQELTALYEKGDKSLILDGEIYSHNMDLQMISGIVRAETERDEEKDKLQYWAFDCFSLDRPNEPFENRLEELKKFANNSNLLVINETVKVNNEIESDNYYDKTVANGYEGIIYKSLGKPYEYSFNKEKRSSWYLKRKQRFDDEFVIENYTQGKGKDKNCVVFILKTKEGIEFNSVPNGTYEYRKDLYKKCLKNFSQFKGTLAKVQFEDYSSDGVPLRNRMIAFRDLNFD